MDGGTIYHVLIRQGNGLAEVDKFVSQAGSADAAGLHKHFFVSRANQTVVMARDADAPIAQHLRRLSGWQEPRDPS